MLVEVLHKFGPVRSKRPVCTTCFAQMDLGSRVILTQEEFSIYEIMEG